jgi:hypothetical protein
LVFTVSARSPYPSAAPVSSKPQVLELENIGHSVRHSDEVDNSVTGNGGSGITSRSQHPFPAGVPGPLDASGTRCFRSGLRVDDVSILGLRNFVRPQMLRPLGVNVAPLHRLLYVLEHEHEGQHCIQEKKQEVDMKLTRK